MKIRDLPEITSLEDNDLLYAVDSSEGNNGGRKITKQNLKSTVSLSDAEVKAKYEANADTNAFTDAEKAKLAGVEAGATADQNANEVPFDNTGTDISATNVEDAIKEVNEQASAEFRASIVSGRIVRIAGGNARFDGTFFNVAQTDLLLDPSLTNATIYVDLDGSIKVTASNVSAPPYTLIVARASTDLTSVLDLTDRRVKNAQNLVRGTTPDVRDVRAGAAADAGTTGRVSDAGHKHNVLTAAPVAQAPNQANSEGNSIELARANHVHQIPTAAPSSTLAPSSTNAEGAGTAFAKDTHTHAIAVGADGDVSTIVPNATPATGVVDKFARAGHTHGIATAAPSTNLKPSSTNDEGTGNNFARATHSHAHDMAVDADVSTIVPNAAPATGAVDKFSKAGHTHGIATAAPSGTLAPSSTNTEGAGNNFARATHTHAFAMAADADVSTIIPNATPAAGAVDKFAKAGHTHGIATAAPVDTGTANSEGSGNNFARANHVHNTVLVSGSVRATANTNTTSATDVALTTMTVTPVAGTYLVWFEAAAACTNNTATMTFSVYSGGSQVTNTERAYIPTNATIIPVATSALVTVNGSQAIEIRYRVSAGTCNVNGRGLSYLRVG